MTAIQMILTFIVLLFLVIVYVVHFNKSYYDEDGYDRRGYNKWGFDRKGYDRKLVHEAVYNLTDSFDDYDPGFKLGRYKPGVYYLTVDLHGLYKRDAKKLMQVLLDTAPQSVKFLEVIHGYNHGQVLKTYINEELQHRNISSIEKHPRNQGVTIIVLK